MEGLDQDELLDEMVDLVRADDWTLDACRYQNEIRSGFPEKMVGAYRVWADCGDSSGLLYDGYFTPEDGGYVGTIQIVLPNKTSTEVAEHILQSVAVLPEGINIPTPSPAPKTGG